MNWYRKYTLFALGLTACGVVFLAELALGYERYAATREAAKRLEQRQVELESMAQLVPPPTREVASAIEADLAKAQKSLAAMKAELTGKGAVAEKIRSAKVPAARTDSFFDLAAFVERMKELAEKNSVEIRPEAARFGYSKYANEGPETDRIEPIFRQRQVAEYLIESLLEARPRALLAVKRERTMTKAEREARDMAIANGQPVEDSAAYAMSDSPDYFLVDPRVTARVPGHIDAVGFRFVFLGQTAALRNFLNRLASFDLPVLVREVEVDVATAEETQPQPGGDTPAAAPGESSAAPSVVLAVEPNSSRKAAPKPETSTPARTPRTASAAPIVLKSFSKYTVTVEFIELVPGATPAGGTETPANPTS